MSLDSNIKFLGVNSDLIDLTEKKDAKNNSKTEYYSLDDIRGYKVYTALLTQSGTDAPIATVLENTIGDIVWSRIGTGNYLGTLNNAFTVNKTFLYIKRSVADDDGFNYITLNSASEIQIINITNDWSNTGYTYEIEIRVYN